MSPRLRWAECSVTCPYLGDKLKHDDFKHDDFITVPFFRNVYKCKKIAFSVPNTPSVGIAIPSESEYDRWMFAIAFSFVRVLYDYFKSRRQLLAEILALRHQLNVLQQRPPRRLYLIWTNRC